MISPGGNTCPRPPELLRAVVLPYQLLASTENPLFQRVVVMVVRGATPGLSP